LLPTLKIGTRDSVLALWQTKWVVNELKKVWPNLDCQVIAVKTKGDKILDVSLSKIGDKGLFTKELETSLLGGQIDLAVHSLKDLPTELPIGCSLGAICRRTEPGDVLISKVGRTLKELPPSSRIGTSSLRRKAQILYYRPDLQIKDLRGNIPTRLQKLEQADLDAIVIAAAGVERLGLRERIAEYLPYEICLPAVGQGAIALEQRTGDHQVRRLIAPLHDEESAVTTLAERALLRRLEGGCQIPIAALGRRDNGRLILDARVASIDGSQMVMGTREIDWPIRPIIQANSAVIDDNDSNFEWSYQAIVEQIGRELAEELLDQGARSILETIRACS
jgi:hydroxymethylbilane synthase